MNDTNMESEWTSASLVCDMIVSGTSAWEMCPKSITAASQPSGQTDAYKTLIASLEYASAWHEVEEKKPSTLWILHMSIRLKALDMALSRMGNAEEGAVRCSEQRPKKRSKRNKGTPKRWGGKKKKKRGGRRRK
jgi:hypothetical protein